MKRLIVICCCLSVFIAGLASAWASCKQVAITADHRRAPVAAPAENHHSEAQHDHSQGTVIHCATLDEFLLTSTFSVTKDHRVQRVTDPFVAALHSPFRQHLPHRLIHGPPGLSRLNSVPPYLLLSVLRI
jgi:hypothetical protein